MNRRLTTKACSINRLADDHACQLRKLLSEQSPSAIKAGIETAPVPASSVQRLSSDIRRACKPIDLLAQAPSSLLELWALPEKMWTKRTLLWFFGILSFEEARDFNEQTPNVQSACRRKLLLRIHPDKHPADEREFWNCIYQRVEADSNPFQEVIDNMTGESFPMTLYSASRVLNQAMHEQSAVAQLAVREREALQNNERLAQMQSCVDKYREAAETSLETIGDLRSMVQGYQKGLRKISCQLRDMERQCVRTM